MRIARSAAVLLAALSVASCGTRLPDEAFSNERTVSAAAPRTRTTSTALAETTDTTVVEGAAPSADPRTPAAVAKSAAGVARAADTGPNRASDVGITETTITLGNITAENGVLGDAFAPAVRGVRAWAAYTNAHGGIHGRKIILKTCDDREDRARDLACAQQLVERDKVFALVGTNTRVLGGSAQYLNDHAVPTIGIPITNSFYRYPHLWSGYRNGYPRDGQTVGYKGNLANTSGVFRWFKEKLGVSTAAVFAYDIDESKQAGDLFQHGLELEGYKVTQYVVSFAAPSFDQAVADMQRQGTQIVFDAMDDGANRKLCDAMQRRNYHPKAKVSTVVSMGDRVGTDYNDTCRNSVYIATPSRAYSDTSVPEIAKFRQAYARYQPGLDVHQWALEAWTMAQMVATGIDSMGAAPTRTGLEQWFRSLRAYSGDGVLVGLEWTPEDYTRTRTEDCFDIHRWLDAKGGWVDATDKFPFCYPDAYLYLTKALEQGN